MYADNTLTPKEAVRLCALGYLAERDMRYSELAAAVRHFTGRVMGPTLELLGTSLELLRYEGLLAPVSGAGMEDDALLALTGRGRGEFFTLLTARLRPASDLSKLVVALKFRFLHLLQPVDKTAQAELLIETCESELHRLLDLRGHQAQETGYLTDWLDHEIGQLESRLTWLEDFAAQIARK